MATSGEMVAATARLFDVPVTRVETLDRRLSEHGLRTKGGRGRSAAHMVGLDVVNLTFAVMSGAGMMEAPAATKAITSMKRGLALARWTPASGEMLAQLAEGTDWHMPDPSELEHFPHGTALARANTFGEAVGQLVDAIAVDQLKISNDTTLSLKVTNDGPMASITFQVGNGVLQILFGAFGKGHEKPVIEQSSVLTGTTLQKLADIIRPT